MALGDDRKGDVDTSTTVDVAGGDRLARPGEDMASAHCWIVDIFL
jgi:hypothetical protein